MKTKYLKFIKRDGTALAHPRAHLRWMELPGESELKLGFSSRSIVITGGNLGKLAAEILRGERGEIQEEEERHLDNPQQDIWVESITGQAHARAA